MKFFSNDTLSPHLQKYRLNPIKCPFYMIYMKILSEKSFGHLNISIQYKMKNFIFICKINCLKITMCSWKKNQERQLTLEACIIQFSIMILP